MGDSTYSGVATVVFKVPTAPSGLTATGTSTTQVSLSWIDNVNNETAFDVERSPNGTSGWSALTSTAANTASYSNTGLPAARGTITGSARRTIGGSLNSATASGAVPPAQAFKVANSSGTGPSWENVTDGFYYITYAAFKAVSI